MKKIYYNNIIKIDKRHYKEFEEYSFDKQIKLFNTAESERFFICDDKDYNTLVKYEWQLHTYRPGKKGTAWQNIPKYTVRNQNWKMPNEFLLPSTELEYATSNSNLWWDFRKKSWAMIRREDRRHKYSSFYNPKNKYRNVTWSKSHNAYLVQVKLAVNISRRAFWGYYKNFEIAALASDVANWRNGVLDSLPKLIIPTPLYNKFIKEYHIKYGINQNKKNLIQLLKKYDKEFK